MIQGTVQKPGMEFCNTVNCLVVNNEIFLAGLCTSRKWAESSTTFCAPQGRVLSMIRVRTYVMLPGLAGRQSCDGFLMEVREKEHELQDPTDARWALSSLTSEITNCSVRHLLLWLLSHISCLPGCLVSAAFVPIHPVCSAHPPPPRQRTFIGCLPCARHCYRCRDTARNKTDQKACPGRTEGKQKTFSLVCV